MKRIPLTKGKFALVDDDTFEYLNQWKWYCSNPGYGARRQKKRIILMHRLIVNCPEGMEVDHINGNSLDNRRENLRIVTHQQNLFNQKMRKTNTTGYKGVTIHLDKRTGWTRYTAHIMISGKNKTLGYFKTKEEAAGAYQQASRKYFSEYARAEVN